MSNETLFTPGSWVLTESMSNVRPKSKANSVNSTLAVLVGYPWRNTKRGREAKANAHLIAAAPDLYAALEELARVAPAGLGDDQDSLFEAQQVAQAALAKARGKVKP